MKHRDVDQIINKAAKRLLNPSLLDLSCCCLGKSRGWLTFSVPKRGGKKSIFPPFLKLALTNGINCPRTWHTTRNVSYAWNELPFFSSEFKGIASVLMRGKCEHLEMFSFSFFEEVGHQNLTPDFTPMHQHLHFHLSWKWKKIFWEWNFWVLFWIFLKKSGTCQKLEGLIKQQILFVVGYF